VTPAHYRLLSRHDCHLCEEMASVLEQVLPGYGLAYDTVDVDEVEQYRQRYGDTVPVLLRDGRAVAKVRVDRRQLHRIVRRRR
jgi:hypothetical protein